MNLRNVLSAYSKLRQLTDDESALLETLRGLNDAERESLVVALQPEKTATKRASKKSSKPASKSARASGMAAAIHKSLNRPREGACAYVLENGAMCNTGDNNPIHDESFGYVGYHPFQPLAPRIPQVGPNDICGKRDCGLVYADNVHHQTEHEHYHPFDPKKFARAAARRSSTNGGAGSTTQSIETEKVVVGVVAGGSNE